VHHQRKSGGSSDKGIRKGEMLRGHSSIEAALDLALLVERKEGEDSVAIIPTKVRGFREHNIFGALFTYDHRPGTRDLALGRFYGVSVMTKEEREIDAIQESIKKALRGGKHMKQSDLVNEVRADLAGQPGGTAPGIHKVRGVLKKMVEAKTVLCEGSGVHLTYRLL
jgi:hypothetical protein